MRERSVWGRTLPDAYHNALWDLWCLGHKVPCSQWGTQTIDCAMTMIVEEPLKEPRISRCTICGPRELEQYRQEMLDGILDFEVDRGKWAYTYHRRMGDQVDFVIRELREHPDSRRAVIDIRAPEDMGSEEPACLQHLQYFIFDGKLDCIATFRSNDACKATFMNAFALICLQERIAKELGLGVGVYTHRANSFHAYERDWDLLSAYVKSDKNTYYYKGDWDERMEDEKEDISKMVEQLRGQG